MAGADNLIPLTERCKEDAKAIRIKGAIARGQKVQKMKTLKEELLLLLSLVDEKTGLTNQELATIALLNEVKKGTPKAFEVLRDTAGQKPIEVKELIDNRTDSKLDKLISNIDKLKNN